MPFLITAIFLCLISTFEAQAKSAKAQTQMDSSTMNAQPPATAEVPNDPQIAAIVMAANDGDIEGGKLAQRKGKNPEIRQFGREMIQDHERANGMLKSVLKTKTMFKRGNQTSDGIEKMNSDTIKKLNNLNGDAFDRAYIDNEVIVHQMVLTSLDQDLIPNAQIREMKDYLAKIRPIIADHLEHAKNIQKSITDIR